MRSKAIVSATYMEKFEDGTSQLDGSRVYSHVKRECVFTIDVTASLKEIFEKVAQKTDYSALEIRIAEDSESDEVPVERPVWNPKA